MAHPDTQTIPDEQLFPDRRCRLILIGKTGNGKSSTGNTILGRDAFKAQTGINSETKQCGFDESEIKDLKVMVMDTPGLCDTDGLDDKIKLDIARSLYAVEPGPHALLLCLRCDKRFTREEYQVIQMLKDTFGQKMTDYLIVIFAGRDALDSTDEGGFEEQLQKAHQGLKQLLEENHRRYILFNNRTSDKKERRDQVWKLLDTVREVVRQNGGSCFLHKEAKSIHTSMHKMMKEELRLQEGNPLAEGDSAAVRSATVKKETEKTIQLQEGSAPTEMKPSNKEGKQMTDDNKVKEETGHEEDNETMSFATREKLERDQDVRNITKRGTVAALRKRFTVDAPIGVEMRSKPGIQGRESTRRHAMSWSNVQADAVHEELKSEARADKKDAGIKLTGVPTHSPPSAKSDEAKDSLDTSDAEDDTSSVHKPTEDNITSWITTIDRKLEDDPEMRHLLDTVKGLPGLTAREKRQELEDCLRRALATAPIVSLSSTQQKCLKESATSAGKKLEQAMAKRNIKTLEQCRLM